MANAYEKFLPYALEVEKTTGIPAPISIGQAMLESGAGLNSGLVQKANNLFGVKGTGPAGSVYMPTKENVNGRMVTVNAQFRKYNSPYESFLDHAKVLQQPRYQPYLTNAQTLEDWAKGIKAGGYATDDQYVSKLLGVISSNNLDQLGSGGYSLGSYAANLENTNNPIVSTGIQENAQAVAKDIIKWVALLVLLVMGVIFLMNSIPMEKAAEQLTNAAGKVIKPVKAAKKITKAIKK